MSRKLTILLIDDDSAVHTILKRRLGHVYDFIPVANGLDALRALAESDNIDVILLDLVLPDIDGMKLLERIRREHPNTPTIMLTAHGSVENAVAAIRTGAYDYLTKPIETEKLLATLRHAIEHQRVQRELAALRDAVRDDYGFDNAVGRSPSMLRVFQLVRQILDAKSPVLLTGESGVGKEVIARVLHFNSHRREAPFVAVNCAAIPEELLESELFGHEKGAFTGALQRRVGKFEEARDGTVLLDEVGDMAPRLQAKLLRVLQEREFERVGGSTRLPLDARIVAATNRDLEAAIKVGEFREDLYYRLNVIAIEIPPLRERPDDIPLLVQHMLRKVNQREGRNIRGVTPRAMDILQAYTWPGNARELENVILRSALVTGGDMLDADALPRKIIEATRITTAQWFMSEAPNAVAPESPPQRPSTPIAGAPSLAETGHQSPFATTGTNPGIHASIPLEIASSFDDGSPASTYPPPPAASRTLQAVAAEAESRQLRDAIAAERGHMSNVAKRLGISRATLYRKLQRHNIRV